MKVLAKLMMAVSVLTALSSSALADLPTGTGQDTVKTCPIVYGGPKKVAPAAGSTEDPKKPATAAPATSG